MTTHIEPVLPVPARYWTLIEQRAEQSPDLTAFVDARGRSCTFKEFRDLAERVAAGLATVHGIGSGSRVSWQLPTTLEAVVLAAALARLGAVQNPIIPILRSSEVGYIFEEFAPDFFVVPGVFRDFDYLAMAKEVIGAADIQVIVSEFSGMGEGELALPLGDPARLAPWDGDGADDDQVRFALYTSGSTANPKGVAHTELSILHGSNGITDNMQLRSNDRFPLVFPFTHVGGLTMLAAQLRVGASLYLVEAFSPEAVLEFAKWRPTLVGSALPFFRVYLAIQRENPAVPLFPDLRVAVSGGAPTPADVFEDVKRELGGLGIIDGWGLTECPIATYGFPGEDPRLTTGSVGRLSSHVELKVADDAGRRLHAGETGELRLKAPQMFKTYLDPSLNAAAFDDEGYFRTGDLGYISPAGVVFVTGRLKDIIIRSGENISATEVEHVLYSHPDIADVAVIGLPHPKTGEQLTVVAVLRDGVDSLSLESVVAHCRASGLAPFKWPEGLIVRSDLPRHPQGKILKHKLKESILEFS